MQLISDFPHAITETENCWIPLPGGGRMAAKLWLPDICASQRVPCVIEVIPYRKRDAYAVRDAMQHRYFAGHGFAAMRLDMRGSGDSDGHQGVFDFRREQDDTLAVLEWIERQAWSDGQVSMYGVSWGGLQAIQVAARQPRQLKSVIAVAFAHDHYHYGQVFHGGGVPLRAPRWSAQVFSYKSRPPDPELVGDLWRGMWLERLSHNEPQIVTALAHPVHDGFWAERATGFQDVACPVYAVGGWADIAYAGSVMQALRELPGTRRGLAGPWGHNYPHFGVPGPAIGFLQEAVAWFNTWMRPAGAPLSGYSEAPMLRAWLSRSLPAQPFFAQATGRWVAEDVWPSPRMQSRVLILNGNGRLAETPGDAGWTQWKSPQTAGLQCGELMPWFQHGPAAELPGDQREDDGKSLCFDSAPLQSDVDILGRVTVRLRMAVDQPSAFVCARLCDVAPTGESTRVAIGVLNLIRRDGFDRTAPLTPGEEFDAQIHMVDTGYTFARGHRMRIALSTTYWPLIWPSPHEPTLSVLTGVSSVELPVRPPRAEDEQLPAFGPPQAAHGPARQVLRPGGRTRQLSYDAFTGRTTLVVTDTAGCSRLDAIGLETEATSVERYEIADGDPLACSADIQWTWRYGRGDWQVRTESTQRVSCTADTFEVAWTLVAYEGDKRVFARDRTASIPRNGN